jgi:hypothetical protein
MNKRNGSTAAGGEHAYAGERGAKTRTPWPPVTRIAKALGTLVRARGRLRHVPTPQQVRAMAMLDGWEPCSYLLDPAVNWVPPTDEMPVGLEHQLGQQALCFCCRLLSGHDAELVVFPSGHGFVRRRSCSSASL